MLALTLPGARGLLPLPPQPFQPISYQRTPPSPSSGAPRASNGARVCADDSYRSDSDPASAGTTIPKSPRGPHRRRPRTPPPLSMQERDDSEPAPFIKRDTSARRARKGQFSPRRPVAERRQVVLSGSRLQDGGGATVIEEAVGSKRSSGRAAISAEQNGGVSISDVSWSVDCLPAEGAERTGRMGGRSAAGMPSTMQTLRNVSVCFADYEHVSFPNCR